jgi:hypothetical protein
MRAAAMKQACLYTVLVTAAVSSRLLWLTEAARRADEAVPARERAVKVPRLLRSMAPCCAAASGRHGCSRLTRLGRSPVASGNT